MMGGPIDLTESDSQAPGVSGFVAQVHMLAVSPRTARHYRCCRLASLTGQLAVMLTMVCYTFAGLYFLFGAWPKVCLSAIKDGAGARLGRQVETAQQLRVERYDDRR
ncbi:hypothetical protein MDOR_37410 [Mycolicibacterium doricum]|uniref:Uncharacterized protein n=1 Tax=Mycolicibacterium doricum TaxID=126673 RepID=A0A7I7VY49_9MYCO|nr:hypothetical protein MDOR_37410 [Mycolicibacterium doricum]